MESGSFSRLTICMTFLTIEYIQIYNIAYLLGKHIQSVKHTIVDKIGTTSTYNTYVKSLTCDFVHIVV